MKANTEAQIYRYKKVEDWIQPVPATMPEDIKVQCTFPRSPLNNLPALPKHAPEFIPTEKLSSEQMEKLNIDNNPHMTEEEQHLLRHVLAINERSIAFTEDERGTFQQDYFTDYKIPVVAHTPWMDRNIPLPLAQHEEIIQLLKEKMETGVYEKAQSSYRSWWFRIQKKGGGLRIVHDLQNLNGVTI